MNSPLPLDPRTELVGLSRAELADELVRLDEKAFRAKQLWHWIYHQGETDFAKMTTLSKEFRVKIAETHKVTRPCLAALLAQHHQPQHPQAALLTRHVAVVDLAVE